MPTLSQVLPPLDEKSAQPLYQQLQRALRGAIENRVIGPDDALPPERDLAEMLNVSRITVRKAIDELVEDGLLIRKQGSGTFVSNRKLIVLLRAQIVIPSEHEPTQAQLGL